MRNRLCKLADPCDGAACSGSLLVTLPITVRVQGMPENIPGNTVGELQVQRSDKAVAGHGGRLPAVRGHLARRGRP